MRGAETYCQLFIVDCPGCAAAGETSKGEMAKANIKQGDPGVDPRAVTLVPRPPMFS